MLMHRCIPPRDRKLPLGEGWPLRELGHLLVIDCMRRLVGLEGLGPTGWLNKLEGLVPVHLVGWLKGRGWKWRGLNRGGGLERPLVWVVEGSVPVTASLLFVVLFAVFLAVLLPATEGDVEFHSCALPPLLHPPGSSTRPGLAGGLD
jgi:hypothetical protein